MDESTLIPLAYPLIGAFWGRIFCRLVSEPGEPEQSAFWFSVFMWPLAILITIGMASDGSLPGRRTDRRLPEWVFCQRPPKRQRLEDERKQILARKDELERELGL